MTPRLYSRLRRAGTKFILIDGTQWAGALAYSAFASLFPMILLFVTAASFINHRDSAGRAVIGFVQNAVPMSPDMRRLIVSTVSGIVAARGRAGAAALIILVCVSSQCFSTFVCATNRAWNVAAFEWWRLPLKSLLLLPILASAPAAGMILSTLTRLAIRNLPGSGVTLLSGFTSRFFPLSVEFIGLGLFYRFAPSRPTRFAEVWGAAGIATLLLRAAENLFVLYLEYFPASYAIDGAFGGIMALLLWIYVSGCIFIYGACLCASWEEDCASAAFAAPPQ